MEEAKDAEEKVLLPHHVQQELCTTRLPYRQGRKLTAVKVYTVNNESCHLLIFGVPSLNLRQETKAQFMRYGKLLQFSISKNHDSEQFTETYHAVYERIQSARYAKKIMDTKNFYGGSLHITYAPELETVAETRQKLLQRRKDIAYRLRNLNEEAEEKETNAEAKREEITNVNEASIKMDTSLLYMGDLNEISVGKQPREVIKKLKRKHESAVIEKRFKPCFVQPTNLAREFTESKANPEIHYDSNKVYSIPGSQVMPSVSNIASQSHEIEEIVDCSQSSQSVVTNIYESLNYNRFGSEVIKKLPKKPLNVIKFKNK